MIPASELIQNSDGSIYHIALKPGELAPKIIFVGDQDRVDVVASHFDSVEFVRQKREFKTATGSLNGQRISCISTGIGTDNIDIVLTEIDALFNIDFENRVPVANPVSLRILRLGTSGGLRAETPVDTLLLSSYAIGMESLLHFYEWDQDENTKSLDQTFAEWFAKNTKIKVIPYAAPGSPLFTECAKINFPAIQHGITFTANGFYGPQGRFVERLVPKDQQLLDKVSQFSWNDHKVSNLEMETSGILGMAQAMGHHAASLSVLLANRETGDFVEDHRKSEEMVVKTGLELLLKTD